MVIEQDDYLKAIDTIAIYIVDRAVKVPSADRDRYLTLAKGEVHRGVLNAIREEMAKR